VIETSEAASGAAAKTSTSERNKRFCERRGGLDVDEENKHAMP
jgi:hypothetical protein